MSRPNRIAALAVVALALVSSSLAAQDARPEEVLRDRLAIKLVDDLPRSVSLATDRLDSTGDATLDAVLREVGIDRMERIFRVPTRGWRNPASAAELGLERWLEVFWSEDQEGLEDVVALLRAQDAVEVCEQEARGYVADTTPNDPDFSKEWGLQLGILKAEKAWDIQTTSTKVVAVIDTGSDLDHLDLAPNLWANPGEVPGNGLDDDGNGYIDDTLGWDFAYGDREPEDLYGHGVHCQGTVGAATNNNLQVAGVCWQVPIMVVQVLDRFGGGTQSNCAAGIVYAADNGASVLSMSWGYFSEQKVLATAVSYAASLDLVQVAAAHNFASTTKMWPAANENVMGIIATDYQDKKASWSNYGSWCDMAAPGDSVLSTWLNDGTAYISGTSMATPHVAGAAALIREVNPALDATDTRWVLNYSTKDLGTKGFDIFFGWGRLNLFSAVIKAQSLAVSRRVAAPGDTVTIDLDSPFEAGFVHVLLVSRNGRRPGLSLNGFDPNDYRQMALNQDPPLWNFLFGHPTGAGVFNNFIGTLDAAGQGQATLNIPPGTLFLGEYLDFVALTFDPSDFTRVSSVTCSNRVQVR